MVILTNALTGRTDEGCLKVAQSLVSRIKKAKPDTCVVTYDHHSDIEDAHFSLNKLLFSPKLARFLRQKKENVLYLPFPAKTMATALRVFMLSLMTRRPLRTVMVLQSPMNAIAKLLLRMSRTKVVVLSADAAHFYRQILPADRVEYIKTGVDTRQFVPVSEEKKLSLKAAFGLDPLRPVVLHVGHLKEGRGVRALLRIDPKYQVVLVTSTLTQNEQDNTLRAELEARKNVRIIDTYIPHIEEVYQLADVYLFPVTAMGNCIDVPLSCLEAAACGLPVIATAFGEMKEFKHCPGFIIVDTLPDDLQPLLEQALSCPADSREGVLPYDWDGAAQQLLRN